MVCQVAKRLNSARWPVSASSTALEYLRKALQWGVEFIDVEDYIGDPFTAELSQRKGNTKVIASYHDLSGRLDWTSTSVQDIYRRCSQFGDIVQIVGFATKLTDNYEVENFRRRSSTHFGYQKPLIAFNTGVEGKLSRILNPFLEPTTHHLLPISSAPDQLTLAEANR